MIAEFDECPECGTGPSLSVRVDKSSVIAVRLRCGCGEVDEAVPIGLPIDVLADAWNDHVRQHIRGRVQSAMVDAVGRQFADGREVGLCKATNPLSDAEIERLNLTGNYGIYGKDLVEL